MSSCLPQCGQHQEIVYIKFIFLQDNKHTIKHPVSYILSCHKLHIQKLYTEYLDDYDYQTHVFDINSSTPDDDIDGLMQERRNSSYVFLTLTHWHMPWNCRTWTVLIFHQWWFVVFTLEIFHRKSSSNKTWMCHHPGTNVVSLKP